MMHRLYNYYDYIYIYSLEPGLQKARGAGCPGIQRICLWREKRGRESGLNSWLLLTGEQAFQR